MKRTRQFFCTLLLLFSGITCLYAQQLEIHQLDVGNADAAIVISRKENNDISKVMIIDVGYNSSADLTGKYLTDVLGYKGSINYMIISHYDTDHQGGYKKFNREYLKKNNQKIDTLYIPGGLDNSLQWPKKGSTPGQNDWTPYIDDKIANTLEYFFSNITNSTVSVVKQISTIKSVDQTFTFDVINGVPVTMDLVAGLQYVRNNPNRILNSGDTYNNDCLAWVMQFGTFRFYTGGDLGGYNTSGYVDHETPLANYLAAGNMCDAYPWGVSDTSKLQKGHVCIAKLNHHGSDESSNRTFIKTLNPSAWLISGGGKHEHPRNAVMGRLLNTTSTAICDKKTRYFFYYSSNKNRKKGYGSRFLQRKI